MTNLAQVSLSTDNVFGDDGGASQTPTFSGDVANGYAVALTVGVDTTTAAVQGMASGSGSGEAPAGGQGGPGGEGGTPPSGMGTPPDGAPSGAPSATTTS